MAMLHEGVVDLGNSLVRGRHLDPLTLELLLPPFLGYNLCELLLLGSKKIPTIQLENLELVRLNLDDLAFELRVFQSVLLVFDFGQ